MDGTLTEEGPIFGTRSDLGAQITGTICEGSQYAENERVTGVHYSSMVLRWALLEPERVWSRRADLTGRRMTLLN